MRAAARRARSPSIDAVSVNPDWSPLGDRIAYVGAPAKGKPPQIYVLRLDGGDSQKVTDAKTGVSSFEWRPDSSGFAYVSEDEAHNKAAIEKHAFVTTSPRRAAELSILRPGEREPRTLTHFTARIAARALTNTREVRWRSSDGYAADGALTEPAGFVRGKSYPLIMLIHGGPTATSTTSYSSLVQLMAARGWFVFQPNYRGSDNAGAAWAQATVPHITSAPARDCEEGLAQVVKTENIDRTRIGVTGWSEGGLMTSWLITHDTRWKSALSGAAVNDCVQYGDLTDSKDFTPSFIGPSPWTSDAMMRLYKDESPLTYASAVKTRTLIMTDAGDQRVPTPLDYEFYHEIRATGTPVEMMIFPRNGHNPTDPVGQEVRTREWVGWFARTR